MPRPQGPKSSAAERDALARLRALYAEVDALFAGVSCPASTDCCRFGVTGREPYPTAIEAELLRVAVRARGGIPRARSLPVADERRCPLLSDAGRCLVYDARPFGCRTFFCERADDGARAVSRRRVLEIASRIAALSESFAPRDPKARPLSGALSAELRR